MLERGDFRPAGRGELEPGSGLERSPLPDDGTLDRRRRPRVPPVHALLRRRQHQVLGQRAVSAAPRGLPGGRARRRRLAGVADRLRHARALLRPRRAPVSRARRARRRSHRTAARTVSVRADSASPRHGGDRRAAARVGLHPSPLPLGLIVRASGRLHAVQHVQLVRVQVHAKSDAESVASPRRSSARTSSCGPMRMRAPADTDATAPARRGRGGGARRQTVRVEASLFVVSCGAVNSAALLLRSASDQHPHGLANSSGLVGTPLHGASRDDDAGLPSVPEERRRCSRRRSRSTTTTCADRTRRYPLGQIQSQGRTHGVMARSDHVGAAGAALSGYDWWVARGVDWLAMSEDLPRRRQPRHPRSAAAGFSLQYRPNNVRPIACW